MDLITYTRKYYPIGWKSFFLYCMDNIEKISNNLNECEYHPEPDIIWSAFYLTPYNNVKVVIIGQDPYPNYSDACGVSFSCKSNIPPSLKNIFNVLKKTVDNFEIPDNGDLTKWCVQGVLMLNATLTYEKTTKEKQQKISNKHKERWALFTEELLKKLSKKDNIVYMLWGAKAQKYSSCISNNKKLILTASHPSPYSYSNGDEPFSECNHFNLCNSYCKQNNIKKINWLL